MSVDWKETLSGFVGSICCVYTGLPFDILKLRLQTQPQYSGILDCTKQMLKKEGIFSFWKGASPALLSASIENSVVFTFHGLFRRLLESNNNTASISDSLEIRFLAGALAGFFSASAICPAEVLKCRIQFQKNMSEHQKYKNHTKLYKGPLDCASQIYVKEGFAGFFSGLTALWVRDIPFNCIFFGLYETLCYSQMQYWSQSSREEMSSMQVFVAGGLAGSCGWAIIYPVDVVKSHLQSQQKFHSVKKGIWKEMKRIIQMHGLKSFFKGWVPCVLRAFPANAALFTGYEFTYAQLNMLF